jgi:hypothetical protein
MTLRATQEQWMTKTEWSHMVQALLMADAWGTDAGYWNVEQT